MPTTILLRGGTASEWTTADPVLAFREVGLETDTERKKVGDGSTAWSNLPYYDQGLSAALDAAATDDLLGVASDGTVKKIDSGTYRSNLPVDLGKPHGWHGTRGSPTFGTYVHPTGAKALDRQSVQFLADGNAEGVALPFFVPSTAPSWQFKVYWVYAGTSTGDVEIRAWVPGVTAQSQGDDFNDEGSNNVMIQTVTDPGQDILQTITGTSESFTGFLSLHLASWSGSTLTAGEVIHVLGAEIVEA